MKRQNLRNLVRQGEGNTLAGVIVALIIIGVTVAAVIQFLDTSVTHYEEGVKANQAEVRRTFRQQVAVQGIHSENLTTDGDDIVLAANENNTGFLNSTIDNNLGADAVSDSEGRGAADLFAGSFDESQLGARSSAFGLQITGGQNIGGGSGGPRKLNPPLITGDVLMRSWFQGDGSPDPDGAPEILATNPSNPPGTRYFYAIGGGGGVPVPPGNVNAFWDFNSRPVWGLEGFPAALTAIARLEGWEDSDTVTASFRYPDATVIYGREISTGDELRFTFDDINPEDDPGTEPNRILFTTVLEGQEPSTSLDSDTLFFYDLRYTEDDSNPEENDNPNTYVEPFVPDRQIWIDSNPGFFVATSTDPALRATVPLRYALEPKNSLLASTWTGAGASELYYQKEVLTPPEIFPGDGQLASSGVQMAIEWFENDTRDLVEDLIQAPRTGASLDNPTSTEYYFTTDGTSPSPTEAGVPGNGDIFTTQEYSPLTFPAQANATAFHPWFLPSEEASKTYRYPDIDVEYSREGPLSEPGQTETQFTYFEVASAAGAGLNRPILEDNLNWFFQTSISADGRNVDYTDNSSSRELEVLVQITNLIFENNVTGGGRFDLIADNNPRNPNFPDQAEYTVEWELEPFETPLLPPEFSVEDEVLDAGEVFVVEVDTNFDILNDPRNVENRGDLKATRDGADPIIDSPFDNLIEIIPGEFPDFPPVGGGTPPVAGS